MQFPYPLRYPRNVPLLLGFDKLQYSTNAGLFDKVTFSQFLF